MKVYYFDQTHILILTHLHVLTIACESCDKYVPFSSSGQIADRVNLRYFLTVGMIGMHCMFTYVVYIYTCSCWHDWYIVYLHTCQLQYLLTLGAHAQRGLQYLVCVSVRVCVCYSTSHFLKNLRCEARAFPVGMAT